MLKSTPLPLLLFEIKIKKILMENYATSDVTIDTDFNYQTMQ